MRTGRGLAFFALLAACRRAPSGVDAGTTAPATSETTAQSTLAPNTSPAPALPEPSSAPRALRDRSPVIPSALVAAPPTPLVSPHAGLRGPVHVDSDAAWIRRLAAAPIASVRWNGGGSSVTLRVRFDDGARAVLKPEQTRSSSNHRAEIAAYHLDRLVGFGRTAVVVGRRVPRALLEDASLDDAQRARITSEVVAHDGVVDAAMIAWHDGPLVPDALEAGALDAESSRPADDRVLAYGDLFAFDYLIDNTDRWSGGNVLAKGPRGPLVFLDNASSFLPGRARRHEASDAAIARVCRFPATTIAALRAIAARRPSLAGALGASLARDPLAPVLDDLTRAALDERVTALLAHVDRCVANHGAARVLVGDDTP